MSNLLYSPFFGVALTLGTYSLGHWLSRWVPRPLANPLILGAAMTCFFLLGTGIPVEAYFVGADLISFLLPLATLVLAVSIYRNFALLRNNLLPVCAGCLAGAAAALCSVALLSHLFGLDPILTASILPKSTTASIAIDLAQSLGGVPAITVLLLVISGVTGVIIGPLLIQWCSIKNPVVAGVAMGTSAHGIGTAKAIELGEVQGAISGVSIGVTGIFTTILLLLFF